MNEISAIERFYNGCALDYFDQTVHIDMDVARSRFIDSIAPGGLIVDAGCGSGRDTRWFMDQGFPCYSYDASEALVVLARRFLGAPYLVQCHRHDALGLSRPAAGIWASASLLFLNDTDLALALRTFYRNLAPGGVLYASFKGGKGWRQDGQRHFRDLRPSDAGLLEEMSGMHLVAIHTDEDSQGRGMKWHSFLLRKEI
jgi:SAM-dependent methyltransferase